MDLTCPNGHAVHVDDPADDGWTLTVVETHEWADAEFADGTHAQVERSVFTPTARSIIVKCGEPTPTEEAPTLLCGALFTVEQDI